jgi:hypothetical protein
MTLTATAEPETAAPAPSIAERPVFAATTPARPRALKLAGRVTAGLVALWLVALVLGTFGFGPVAGIGLPRIGGDAKPQREAAHRTQAQQPSRRVTQSDVTLTSNQRRHVATGAKRHSGGAHGSSRATATPRSPASHGGGSRGSQPGHAPGASSGGSGASAQAPAASSTPASTATPTGTTQTATHGNSTHSQATPPGSSSTAPGSRSNAGTAPGRDQSTASPSPGSGRSDHAPPAG